MKILIYDNNIDDLKKLYTMISAFPIDTLVDKASDYNDFIRMYTSHQYDKLFIEYTDDIGKKILDEVLNINAKQEIILLNDEYNCLLGKDCKLCKSIHNKKTIIKPINHKQLGEIICKKLSCEVTNKNDTEFKLEKIKKTITEQYPFLVFDINKNDYSIISEPMSVSILVSVTSILEKNSIDYEVIDNQKINLSLNNI